MSVWRRGRSRSAKVGSARVAASTSAIRSARTLSGSAHTTTQRTIRNGDHDSHNAQETRQQRAAAGAADRCGASIETHLTKRQLSRHPRALTPALKPKPTGAFGRRRRPRRLRSDLTPLAGHYHPRRDPLRLPARPAVGCAGGRRARVLCCRRLRLSILHHHPHPSARLSGPPPGHLHPIGPWRRSKWPLPTTRRPAATATTTTICLPAGVAGRARRRAPRLCPQPHDQQAMAAAARVSCVSRRAGHV